MAYRFSCPTCSKEILVRYLHKGEPAECKRCGELVRVPEDAQEVNVKPPAAQQSDGSAVQKEAPAYFGLVARTKTTSAASSWADDRGGPPYGKSGMTHPRRFRRRAIDALRRRLERMSCPRFQMTIIVILTGATGFLATYLLLLAGFRTIWMRYAIAVTCAYAAFLLFIRIWLSWAPGHLGLADDRTTGDRAGHGSATSGDAVQFHGGGGAPSGPDGEGELTILAGQGGGEAGEVPAASEAGSVGSSSASGGHGGGGGSGGGGDGEGIVVVVVAAAALAAVIAAGYVIYIAPTLFAELILDGSLSLGLRRRMRRLEERHWLDAAVMRTGFPFLVVLAFFVVAGVVMQHYYPDATTIADVCILHAQANP
jgi:hypothetical protein